jgi:hypothetical protein
MKNACDWAISVFMQAKRENKNGTYIIIFFSPSCVSRLQALEKE